MKHFLFIIAISALLTACQPDTTPTSADGVPAITADEVVQLDAENYGCEYAIMLETAVDHYQRHELSAWASTINGPGCFSDLPPALQWTVLQIRGDAAQIGFETTSQYDAGKTDAPNVGQKSYWVPLASIHRVSESPPEDPLQIPPSPASAAGTK